MDSFNVQNDISGLCDSSIDYWPSLSSQEDKGFVTVAKKKKYVSRKDDDWNSEANKEHKKAIADKEKRIVEKYREWWDDKNHKWKKGFSGH